jgi:hypothetical protein
MLLCVYECVYDRVYECMLCVLLFMTGWVPDLPRGRGGRGPVWGLLPVDGPRLS